MTMTTKMMALAAFLGEFKDAGDEVQAAMIDLLEGKDEAIVQDEMTDSDDASELERLVDELEQVLPNEVSSLRRKADAIRSKMEASDEDDDEDDLDPDAGESDDDDDDDDDTPV